MSIRLLAEHSRRG